MRDHAIKYRHILDIINTHSTPMMFFNIDGLLYWLSIFNYYGRDRATPTKNWTKMAGIEEPMEVGENPNSDEESGHKKKDGEYV